MKTFFPVAALLAIASAAPTPAPAEGVSFPITDLLESDLTVDQYAEKLESRSVTPRDLTKRQYGGDTYNQLTDGTACREITVIVRVCSNITP